MKVSVRDGSPERRICAAMVVDKQVLGSVAPKWTKEGLFASPWANTVGKWCVTFYNKYQKAPGRDIESVYEDWAEGGRKRDKDTVALVEQFLVQLSGSYAKLRKQSQSDVLIDQAARHFNNVRMKNNADLILSHLEAGEQDRAAKLYDGFQKVNIGLDSWVDVLSDGNAMKRAFETKSDPIVRCNGALGKFLGDSLERNGFVSFEGPEKRGKTWWLLHFAWLAMLQKRKVAFFEVGDLSQDQIMRRFGVRASRKAIPEEDETTYKYPVTIAPVGEGKVTSVAHEERKFTPFFWKEAHNACKKIMSKGGGGLLRLSTHPARSINILEIESIVQDWSRTGWHPDMIVIDYADILAPISGTVETREQVNSSWISMRAMSMKHHCLVMTATQTDTDSYDTDIIEMDNFSEDKRKRAHVTASIGINQTDDEKEMEVYRLNYVVRREHKFSRKKCVHVAGCLAVGNPAVLSTF